MQRRVERRFQLRLGGGDSGTDANPIAEIGQHVRKSRYLRRGAHPCGSSMRAASVAPIRPAGYTQIGISSQIKQMSATRVVAVAEAATEAKHCGGTVIRPPRSTH